MEKLVTRTIKTTSGTAMFVNVQTQEVHHIEYNYSGEYTATDKKLINKIRDEYEDDTLKFVVVNDLTVNENLYGIPEDKFVQLAHILPPRKEY